MVADGRRRCASAAHAKASSRSRVLPPNNTVLPSRSMTVSARSCRDVRGAERFNCLVEPRHADMDIMSLVHVGRRMPADDIGGVNLAAFIVQDFAAVQLADDAVPMAVEALAGIGERFQTGLLSQPVKQPVQALAKL